MKPVKLSPFAESNIQRLKPVQQKAVREAIVRLSKSGLHQSELQVNRLPSGLGYVVAAGKSGRLTVLHSGGGNLLVDDVFVAEDGPVVEHIRPRAKSSLTQERSIRIGALGAASARTARPTAKKAAVKKYAKKA